MLNLVNQANITGGTPLGIASREGWLGIVETLLAAGAIVDLANNFGETPLYIASWNMKLEVVQVLLDAGADKSLGCSMKMLAEASKRVSKPSLLSTIVSKQWQQKTYKALATEELLCTFTFTVAVGPLPGALHSPPHPVQVQVACGDSPIGLRGKGAFTPQGVWGQPIPFDVQGWMRGCQLCYCIQWADGCGSSVMNVVLPKDAPSMQKPLDGVYSNYKDTPGGRELRGALDGDRGYCTLEFTDSTTLKRSRESQE